MASRGHGSTPPEREFHAQDALGPAARYGMIFGGFGAFFAGIQNTMNRRNPSFMSFFSRYGGTTATFAATGAVYAFTKNFSANLREKDDSLNSAYAGFLAGSIQGLRRLSFPAFFGYGTALGVLLYTFDYTGGRWTGYERDPTVDEVERKEALRKNRRRPLSETIHELGESRGVYAPGFEDRRRALLTEKYGHDFAGVPVR